MKTDWTIIARTRANETDAGNGLKAICRVRKVLRSPSPEPIRSPRPKALPVKSQNMDTDVIITPIPSLVATLLNRERAKGSALTREEVDAITESVPCVALTPEQRASVDKRRGYDDIDPERAWEDWQVARRGLDKVES